MQKKLTLLPVCLLFVLLSGLISTAKAQDKNKTRLTLSEALQTIQKRFKTKFAYEQGLLENKFTTVNALKGEGLEEVLKNVLYPNNLIFLYVSDNSYSIVARNAAFFNSPSNTPADTRMGIAQPNAAYTLRGTVRNEKNEALADIDVWVKGSNQATRTNETGGYLLPAVSPGDVIQFSMLGFKKQEITVINQGKLDVTLVSDVRALNEVTVVSTGYQVLPKERATGSFSIVTSKQLEQTPTANVLQRLENQVPGLQLNFLTGDNTFSYTNPGGLVSDPKTKNSIYTLSIRGVSTFKADTYPLIVVDGFPVETDIRSLNPNDIEQITVLKDAAAASIWGIRATNGVIVIQTKKGHKNQKALVSFNANFGLGSKPDLNKQNLMTSAQMIDFEKELVTKNLIFDNTTADFARGASQAVNLLFAQKRGNITQTQLNNDLAALGASTNYSEYGKYFLQAPVTQDYNLSVNGGGEAYTYFTSVSYAKELPINNGSSTARFTLTDNQTFKLFKVIDFNANLKLANFKSLYNSIGLSPLVNRINPFMPYDHVVDAKGNGISYYQTFNKTFSQKLVREGYLDYGYNYLQEQQNMDNTYSETNVTGNFSLSAPLPVVKGLTANVLYSIEKSFGSSRNFSNKYTYAARDFTNFATSYDPATGLSVNVPYGGILNTRNTNRNNYSLRGQLSYSNKISERHELNMIAGTEIRQTYDIVNGNNLYGWDDQLQIAQYVPSSYNTIYGYATTMPTQGAYTDQKRRFLSYFSNAAYTFMEKYTLSGSIRYDDYNNFGLDAKYRAKPFWSAGGSWNLAKENFISSISWINALQLRATYGLNGNIDRTLHPEASISLAGADGVTGLPIAYVTSPANAALKWETTKVTNVGVDFGFFNGRLNGSFEYYIKKGSDLFSEFDYDPTYGFTRLNRNTATLSGKGFEGSLGGDVIHSDKFSWNVTLNYAFNTNKVTDSRFDNTVNIVNSPTGAGLIKDYPIGYLFSYRFAGLDNKGQTQVYDQHNAIVNSTSPLSDINDLKYAGNTAPKYFGAFNQTFRYKNWNLTAQISYKFDYVFLRNSIPYYVNRGTISYSPNADIDKRWRQAGDERTTNVPGLSNFNYTSYLRYTYADINVLRADNIRLRQVSIGYTFPQVQLEALKIRSLNIQGTVRNLGLIWKKNKAGIDPDFQVGSNGSSLTLRPTSLYNLSLNANF
ncbi:SusC/RagA family TonB-linked outer membrane protein [Mucilaginibacter rubeus]|uniref:SusC/RagA family TonB-linked outer membrane protein n=1 Tax=Mucilaginibacter rubeus TaxID=2027860 RepID=A0AAE6JLX4_9SPHI|nr:MULTISPECIES: SusC/RagA family TonB-linked outer membrane protein [Mucilaginibacter]QEM07155.1 SusC/RagA family TonB-linked outer membrane protein [Mucilaginibacter rubeus]QEM19610.1 SusC/RagA family TonB-linked outer membrane protein [Mucilaginibacter gossypii]QTE43700.1 SusC/RagA family TonB-linked outer membrane protein [Mucilaginibacter rubeus]QTE50300.1 SusC/RagA family TonB-linked outer membrane protein [Mucilaginibacter rubeus]QTE55387.1 SusC/RagA family TonB-linked outer membrane pr